jgi:beta-galactosidase
MFFQWRQSRAGAEKFHSAFVPHGPRDTSPAWLEAVKLGQELRRLDAVCGSRVQAEVAILHDWESWWALELPSKPSVQVTWMTQLESYYRPLFDANVTADFAPPAGDLSRYRLVLAPNLYLVADEAARNLAAYVERGGTLLMSFFSGIVDGNDHIRLGGYPKPFRDLLGIRVDDWLPLGEGRRIALDVDGRGSFGSLWSELVAPEGAEVLATFAEGALAGLPAITRNRHGRGSAYYLATRLDQAEMARLLHEVWTRAGVRPAFEAPAGVEATRRLGDDGSFLFLLNHSSEPAKVAVDGGHEVLSGRALDGGLELGAREVGLIVGSDRAVSV